MKNGYQLEIGWVDRVGKMKRIELRNNSISIIASTLAVAPPLAGKSYSHLCRIFKAVNNVGRTGFFRQLLRSSARRMFYQGRPIAYKTRSCIICLTHKSIVLVPCNHTVSKKSHFSSSFTNFAPFFMILNLPKIVKFNS